MEINDLLQTLKNQLNRASVFGLTSAKAQQLNTLIDRFAVGGAAFEDDQIELLLSPPVIEDLGQEVDAAFPQITEDQEKALQEIVSDAQEMGLYDPVPASEPPVPTVNELVGTAEQQLFDPTGLPESKDQGSVEVPLVMTNEELQSKIDSGELVPVPGSDIDFTLAEQPTNDTPEVNSASDSEASEAVAENDSEETEVVAAGDSDVAEVNELPENTNDAEG